MPIPADGPEATNSKRSAVAVPVHPSRRCGLPPGEWAWRGAISASESAAFYPLIALTGRSPLPTDRSEPMPPLLIGPLGQRQPAESGPGAGQIPRRHSCPYRHSCSCRHFYPAGSQRTVLPGPLSQRLQGLALQPPLLRRWQPHHLLDLARVEGVLAQVAVPEQTALHRAETLQ